MSTGHGHSLFVEDQITVGCVTGFDILLLFRCFLSPIENQICMKFSTKKCLRKKLYMNQRCQNPVRYYLMCSSKYLACNPYLLTRKCCQRLELVSRDLVAAISPLRSRTLQLGSSSLKFSYELGFFILCKNTPQIQYKYKNTSIFFLNFQFLNKNMEYNPVSKGMLVISVADVISLGNYLLDWQKLEQTHKAQVDVKAPGYVFK